MKEQIDTIPLNDAFDSGDECPFCYLERLAEQSTINYVIGPGASYMEPEVREVTAVAGFCREHTKKLYDFGNTLGNALILQSRLEILLDQFHQAAQDYQMPDKRTLLNKNKVTQTADFGGYYATERDCFICNRIEYHMQRYYATFFAMLKDPAFRQKVSDSKGFCMRHFAQVMERAPKELPNAQREWFYPEMLRVMEENLQRIKGDLDWLIAKYDYRNAGADWKNSKDALPRAMEKLQGLHPSDPPFKKD